MQQMVNARIIIAAARRDSLVVPVDQIDNTIRQVTDQLTEQYGSREALEEALAKDWFYSPGLAQVATEAETRGVSAAAPGRRAIWADQSFR